MLSLKKVAVTGGLASGKSTICRMFEECGAYVVSADAIVHQLLSPDSAIGQQVIQLLGNDVVKDRHIDRKKIADKVFSYPETLRELEKIIHPAVFAEIEKQYNQVKNKCTYSLFVVEIPLLFESGREQEYDAIVSVVADQELCRQRFLKQGQRTDEEYKLRMSRQIDPRKKASRTQYVIENDGDLNGLKEQVIKIYSLLTST